MSTPAQQENHQPSQVDTVIHARWVMTMCPEQTVLEEHSVVIHNQRILDILDSREAARRYQALQTFDLSQHLVMPGLINAHCHAPMTLLRGYGDDMPLQPWLEQKIWPAEAAWVNEDFVSDGSDIAMGEMLLAGITCFSDMYFFPDLVAHSAIRANMRAQMAAPVMNIPTVWARDVQEYIHKATLLHDEHHNSPLISTAFGPLSPYTVTVSGLEKVAQLSDELDIPVHIHIHENRQEIEDALKAYGQRPLARLDSLGLLTPHLQAVHMTQLTAEEIETLATRGVHVVHCPSSNLKLASGFCPVDDLQQAGVNVCLGTDGAASNNMLDLLAEMRLAALVGKNISQNAAAVSADSVMRMATIQGARALGLEETTGSLETGKAADIIAVDLEQLNAMPVYQPASALVYSSRASQVSHVWVNGLLNVEEGKLTQLDHEVLQAKARYWGEKIGTKS